MKKKLLILICVFNTFLFAQNNKTKSTEVKVVTWNVQTFFDANQEGTEYSDFINSKYWCKANYESRLTKLCNSIKNINADIYVFQEIENSDVILDISNKLADHSWNQNNSWKFSIFQKNKDDSIGCAILSKYQINSLTAHNLDIKTENQEQPKMRSILKAKIQINSNELTIFVNHWKSKSGGQENSKIWRNWQENQLSSLIKKEQFYSQNIIACGDFNKDIQEFEILTENQNSSLENSNLTQNSEEDKTSNESNFYSQNNYNVLLNNEVQVFSPWIYSNGTFVEGGSYYYKNEWEKIDQIFVCSNNTKISEFKILQGDWCNQDGTPFRYVIYNNQGYSDHLPLWAKIQIE